MYFVQVLIALTYLAGTRIAYGGDFEFDAMCELTLKYGSLEIIDGTDVSTTLGSDVNIECTAFCTGDGVTPALQWKKDGVEITSDVGRIHSVRTTSDRRSVLHIGSFEESDSGIYTCRGWIKGVGYNQKSFNLVLGCPEGFDECDDHRCISSNKVCDGVHDCQDGTDEMECVACEADEFECDDRCMPKRYLCDVIQHCSDGRDEANCAYDDSHCEEDQFHCLTGECIDASYRCDNYADCEDNSDELDCSRCGEDEFECPSGKCVPAPNVCDGFPDCGDFSDENDCEPKCSENEFQCSSGQCVPALNECDGYPDCLDFSDETDCKPTVIDDTFEPVIEVEDLTTLTEPPAPLSTTEEEEMSIDPVPDFEYDPFCDLTMMIEGREIFDGTDVRAYLGADVMVSCTAFCSGTGVTPAFTWYKDGRRVSSSVGRVHYITTTMERRSVLFINDMQGFDLGFYKCEGWLKGLGYKQKSFQLVTGCHEGFEECDNHRCINTSRVCDGVFDCDDRTDEMGCVRCKDNEFECDGHCHLNTSKCDVIQHCSDGSDEKGCVYGECNAGEFRCLSGQCVDGLYRCDNYQDCDDNSDELFCKCDGFTCDDGATCISNNTLCDGVYNCLDHSDELNCPQDPDETDGNQTKVNGTCELALSRNGVEIQNGSSVQVVINDDITVTCSAFCSNTATMNTLEWTKNKTNIFVKFGRVYVQRSISGTSDDLHIQTIRESDQGIYTCVGQSNSHQIKKSFQLVIGCAEGLECDDHKCYNASQVCDGVQYCEDGTDEMECGRCKIDEFKCDGSCHPKSNICDNITQCSDGRDEQNCEPSGCHDNEFLCHDGTCVTNDLVCNDHADCPSGEDEQQHCEDSETKKCNDNEFSCYDGSCIAKTKVCDQSLDCPSGEDEQQNCPVPCKENEFQCNDGKCIAKSKQCDHFPDCSEEEDESHCTDQKTCSEGLLSCDDGSTCYRSSQRCDGTQECSDGADERNCGTSPDAQ